MRSNPNAEATPTNVVPSRLNQQDLVLLQPVGASKTTVRNESELPIKCRLGQLNEYS